MNHEPNPLPDERAGLPSASSMDRVYNCPGSVALERLAPKEAPTDEAQEGSAIAAALETESDEGLDEAGRTIRQRLSDMEREAIDDWACEKEIAPSSIKTIREYRFWIRDDAMMPMASAKPDVVAASSPHALVLNHKTGYLDVPAARGNIQSRIEALAVWHDYDGSINSIRAAIAQFRFKGKFSATDYNLAYLKKAQQELVFNLWRSEQTDASRVPGYWCKYCRAKFICPEAKAAAMLPASLMPSLDVAKKDIPAMVAQLSLPQRAFLRHHEAFIKNVLEANAQSLRKETPEDLAAYGLQLAPSSGVRTLPDVEKLWAVLYANDVTAEEFRSILKAPHGAAQELLVSKFKKANPDLTDKDAKKMADDVLAPAVTMAAREPQLRSL